MQQLRANREFRSEIQESMLLQLNPVSSRLEDGTHGKRHGDFRKAPEGIVDTIGDGIREVVHPVDGGVSIDRCPFISGMVADLIGG